MAQLAKRNRKFNKSCAPPDGYQPDYNVGMVAPSSFSARIDRHRASRIRRGVEGVKSATRKPSYPMGTWKMPGCIRSGIDVRGIVVVGTGVPKGASHG